MRTVSVTDAAGGVIGYDYGPTGLRTSVTGPLGQETRTAYDLAGRVTSVTELDAQGAELSTRSQSYDADGNPSPSRGRSVTRSRSPTTRWAA